MHKRKMYEYKTINRERILQLKYVCQKDRPMYATGSKYFSHGVRL